jgi:hypothetical protein
MQELRLKCLIKWIGEEGLERVLCYHPGGEHYYCIAIEGDNAWPFLRKRVDLEGALKDGKAIIIAQDPCVSALRPNLPPEHQKVRDAAYEVIRELVEDKQCLVYDRKTAGPEIRRAAATHSLQEDKKPVHITTVYKYLRRYWQRGAIPDALQPDLNRCGGRGKERQIGELKLGDVNINGEHVGINVTKQVKECFDKAIEKYYHDGNRRFPFQRAYELMLGDSFASGYSRKNGELTPDILPAEKRPTFAQFQYHYNKNYRKVQSLRARMGDNYVEQNCRGVTRDQTKSAVGIGDIYQIDATTADVYLLDTDTQKVTVGRPIVYLTLDTLSTLVTGLHVTFAHMSYDAARMAVWNAYSDKVEYCKSIGIEGLRPEHWPAKGLPYSLYADRGELLSKKSDRVIENLGIMIATSAAYCPTAKAIVERHFGLLSNSVIDWLPGVVPEMEAKRRPGTKDPRKEATLTVQDFTQALVHAILAYNTTVREDYKLTSAMRKDGIQPIPCEIWAWGMKNNPQLHDMDARKVRLGLLPARQGIVLRDGISFGTLRYTCAKARLEQWFDSQKAFSNSWKVTCSYDPSMVDHIFLLGDTFDATQICDLTESYLHLSGCTWAEVDAWQSEERKRLKALEEDKYQAQVAAQAAIQNIVARAELRRKKNGRPDTSNPKDAQEKEQAMEGQAEARKTMAMVGTAPLPNVPAPDPIFEESKVADEWDEAFEARKRNKQNQEAK